MEGRRVDPTFYPVVCGLKDDEDWEDEANWYKVNPSLDIPVDIERLRDAYREAEQKFRLMKSHSNGFDAICGSVRPLHGFLMRFI